jgi:hypothetical protein
MTSGNKRMISKSEVGDRFTLIQPEAMMAPIVWLMSVHSDCVTGLHPIPAAPSCAWAAVKGQKAILQTSRFGSAAGGGFRIFTWVRHRGASVRLSRTPQETRWN